jgi:hypothetical protein
MDCECYLRKGTLYIPTLGMMSRGFYRMIEPVAVSPVSDGDALYRAFAAAIARGNPKVPVLTGDDDSSPILPKYAGVKSWKAFVREASTWGIRERNGIFRIIGYRKDPPNGWVEDRENVETFPLATGADQVIQRMIAILRDAVTERIG